MSQKIRSFHDLDVYRNTYADSLTILREIIPKLPSEEKYNLADQLRRSCMAIPALIAEGYAKKHHKKAFAKYLDDANGECNEIIVHLSYCKDIYQKIINIRLLEKLIKNYDKSARQIYRLSCVWKNFSREK
jgi:four helix bundle protein